MKRSKRASKDRPAPRLILASIVAAVAAAVLLLPSPALNVAGLGGEPSSPLTAVIVDQLGSTQPNPEFVEATTETLELAGYVVDYVPPEAVTVELYRDLPKGGWDMIVLRTHSTAVISRGEEDVTSVSLFTNESYSRDRYYDEQLQGRIGFAEYLDGGPQYFGITAEFIKSSMRGDFGGATIVMMGCQGLLNEVAADAFIEKGAGDFISWNGLVSAVHTDEATGRLLRHLTVESRPAEAAVALTMDEVGPDPTYGSHLLAR